MTLCRPYREQKSSVFFTGVTRSGSATTVLTRAGTIGVTRSGSTTPGGARWASAATGRGGGGARSGSTAGGSGARSGAATRSGSAATTCATRRVGTGRKAKSMSTSSSSEDSATADTTIRIKPPIPAKRPAIAAELRRRCGAGSVAKSHTSRIGAGIPPSLSRAPLHAALEYRSLLLRSINPILLDILCWMWRCGSPSHLFPGVKNSFARFGGMWTLAVPSACLIYLSDRPSFGFGGCPDNPPIGVVAAALTRASRSLSAIVHLICGTQAIGSFRIDSALFRDRQQRRPKAASFLPSSRRR